MNRAQCSSSSAEEVNFDREPAGQIRLSLSGCISRPRRLKDSPHKTFYKEPTDAHQTNPRLLSNTRNQNEMSNGIRLRKAIPSGDRGIGQRDRETSVLILTTTDARTSVWARTYIVSARSNLFSTNQEMPVSASSLSPSISHSYKRLLTCPRQPIANF